MAYAPRRIMLGVVTGALLLAGCAGGPSGGQGPATDNAEATRDQGVDDPLEPVNRTIFGFNQAVDKVAIRPVTMGYRAVVPSTLRDRVHDFLTNLTEPLTALHSLLQGRPGDAGKSVMRFAFNTTLGMGGLVDIAGKGGVTVPREDAGQTFAVWGMPSGPYLVLPLLGPSNPRDAAGTAVDWFLDPVNAWARAHPEDEPLANGRTVARVIDARSQRFKEINELERTSLDFYAAVRSMYRQHRREAITNGKDDQTSSGTRLDIDAAMDQDTSGEESATGGQDQ